MYKYVFTDIKIFHKITDRLILGLSNVNFIVRNILSSRSINMNKFKRMWAVVPNFGYYPRKYFQGSRKNDENIRSEHHSQELNIRLQEY